MFFIDVNFYTFFSPQTASVVFDVFGLVKYEKFYSTFESASQQFHWEKLISMIKSNQAVLLGRLHGYEISKKACLELLYIYISHLF